MIVTSISVSLKNVIKFAPETRLGLTPMSEENKGRKEEPIIEKEDQIDIIVSSMNWKI